MEIKKQFKDYKIIDLKKILEEEGFNLCKIGTLDDKTIVKVRLDDLDKVIKEKNNSLNLNNRLKNELKEYEIKLKINRKRYYLRRLVCASSVVLLIIVSFISDYIDLGIVMLILLLDLSYKRLF